MNNKFMSMAEKRRFEMAQKQKRQRFTGRQDWSNDDIKSFFDSHPNATVSQIAIMTGKTSGQIVKILMEE